MDGWEQKTIIILLMTNNIKIEYYDVLQMFFGINNIL